MAGRRLARASGSSLWSRLREDPGAVLLLVRHTHAFATPERSFSTADLLEPTVPGAALRGLREHSSTGWVDWHSDGTDDVYRVSLACGVAASRIAEVAGLCDPQPPGSPGCWLPWAGRGCARSVRRPSVACLNDPDHVREPSATQIRHWGYDKDPLARRLVRTWNLPCWLGALVGSLGLPVEVARSLGADEHLFATVQLAVHLVERRTPVLVLERRFLGWDRPPMPWHRTGSPGSSGRRTGRMPCCRRQAWTAPAGVPLLSDLLTLAVENRRLQSASAMQRLEEDLDVLHDALREARAAKRNAFRK